MLPEYADGIGTTAVHMESHQIAEQVLDALSNEGANVVIPRVGGTPDTIQDQIDVLRRGGYRIFVINVDVPSDEAFRRMLGRFAATGRLIDPVYARNVGDGPARTYEILKQEGGFAGFAEIDNSGPIGVPKAIVEDGSGILTGIEF